MIPKSLLQPDLLIGPFTSYKVVVDGRIVPGLTGFPNNGETTLVVDDRFSATFDNDTARQVAWLLSEAIAVAYGYSHAGAKSKDKPFAPMIMDLASIGDPDDLLGDKS